MADAHWLVLKNLYSCAKRFFVIGSQQNYGFLHRKKFLLFLVFRKKFLKTRNKVLAKCSSFLKLVRIFLLRINVPKLRYYILTKNLIFLKQARKFLLKTSYS